VLVCAPGHRLASLTRIAWDDLAGEKVIGFDSDLTIRREIDRVLQQHDAEVRVTMEFDNIETIKRAVEIDAGVALLPEPTVLREVAARTLVMVPLASDELVRPLGIIHRRGKELGSTTRRFIELLQTAGQSDAPRLSGPSGRGSAGEAVYTNGYGDEADGLGIGDEASTGPRSNGHAKPTANGQANLVNGQANNVSGQAVHANGRHGPSDPHAEPHGNDSHGNNEPGRADRPVRVKAK